MFTFIVRYLFDLIQTIGPAFAIMYREYSVTPVWAIFCQAALSLLKFIDCSSYPVHFLSVLLIVLMALLSSSSALLRYKFLIICGQLNDLMTSYYSPICSIIMIMQIVQTIMETVYIRR